MQTYNLKKNFSIMVEGSRTLTGTILMKLQRIQCPATVCEVDHVLMAPPWNQQFKIPGDMQVRQPGSCMVCLRVFGEIHC